MRALAPLLLPALTGCSPAEAVAPVERVLVYWMSYDNDLSPLVEPILEMLEDGVQTPEVVVTVHIDREGPGGMERVVITDQGRTHTALPGVEGSADLGVLLRELDFVATAHPAARTGVVFLDHGGRLGEMSVDLQSGERWLDPRHVAQTLAAWDARHATDLDLVFLQQCGKASVETLHAFAPSTAVVVASEALIGAPNFYYPNALGELSASPTWDAATLGAAMVRHDRSDMYRTYTVASGPGLLDLPGRLQPVLAPLLALDELRWTGGPGPVWAIGGERYLDLFGLLGLLHVENGLDTTALAALRVWWDREVVLTHQVSDIHPLDGRILSGASVLLPRQPGDRRSYADFPLYRETGLDELMDRLRRLRP